MGGEYGNLERLHQILLIQFIMGCIYETNLRSIKLIRNKTLRVTSGAFSSLEIIPGTIPMLDIEEMTVLDHILLIRINYSKLVNGILRLSNVTNNNDAFKVIREQPKRSYSSPKLKGIGNLQL